MSDPKIVPRKRTWRNVVVTLAALVPPACDGGTSSPPPVGSISGQVSIEGQGIDGVTVSLSTGASTSTAGGGRFFFTNVEAGSHTVTISNLPSDASFSATAQPTTITTAGQTAFVNFSGTYIRTASIIGSVTVEGDGLGGVTVRISGVADQATQTDATGQLQVCPTARRTVRGRGLRFRCRRELLDRVQERDPECGRDRNGNLRRSLRPDCFDRRPRVGRGHRTGERDREPLGSRVENGHHQLRGPVRFRRVARRFVHGDDQQPSLRRQLLGHRSAHHDHDRRADGIRELQRHLHPDRHHHRLGDGGRCWPKVA